MKLEAIPCPCGCPRYLASPLFHSVESALSKVEVDELILRWNYFEPEPLWAKLFRPADYSPRGRAHSFGRTIDNRFRSLCGIEVDPHLVEKTGEDDRCRSCLRRMKTT